VKVSEKRLAVVVIGGPNGAGKSTTASLLLPEGLGIRQFVNAEAIVAGLSAFSPESVTMEAGRIMLRRLRELGDTRNDFAYETTLSARMFAPFLRELMAEGYEIHLIYIWLREPALAVERVARRVESGGHFVPDETVRRRYQRGATNFQELYRPLADSWLLCDNSSSALRFVASGVHEPVDRLFDREAYNEFERIAVPA